MKTVLITGGSRGIGAAAVRAFAAAGYGVAFTYCHSAPAARALAAGTGTLAICADNASEKEVSAACETALSAFGHIDCLVNNAAVSSFSLLTDLSLVEWQRTLDVSLTGAFLYARTLLPGMIRRGNGSIVNVTSMWGVTGASCEVHYSAAKAGLIGFTKALAKEVAPSGITVNAIAPGVIDTDMNRALDVGAIAALKEETPLGRLGTPEEVAACIRWLCSEEASFITGQVLGVNGGMVI